MQSRMAFSLNMTGSQSRVKKSIQKPKEVWHEVGASRNPRISPVFKFDVLCSNDISSLKLIHKTTVLFSDHISTLARIP